MPARQGGQSTEWSPWWTGTGLRSVSPLFGVIRDDGQHKGGGSRNIRSTAPGCVSPKHGRVISSISPIISRHRNRRVRSSALFQVPGIRFQVVADGQQDHRSGVFATKSVTALNSCPAGKAPWLYTGRLFPASPLRGWPKWWGSEQVGQDLPSLSPPWVRTSSTLYTVNTKSTWPRSSRAKEAVGLAVQHGKQGITRIPQSRWP